MAVRRVVLVGLSGVGKSTVGRLVAERLGWTSVDTDAALAAEFGLTVPEIFRRFGEGAFRARERAALVEALAHDRVVVASGGGAVVDPFVWGDDLLGRPGTLAIALDADPATCLARLQAQQAAEGMAADRPLLAGDDPLGRLHAMKAARQAAYDRAAVSLPVDNLSADQVAAGVTSLVRIAAGPASVQLETPGGRSAIIVGTGIVDRLGARARRRWPDAERAWIVTDANVARFHQAPAVDSLIAAGFEAAALAVAPGEGSKSAAGAATLYDWLLGGGIERGDVVVALGGGVVGDLAGFVAATVLRGVGLIQVPTSLLAMVDSSVGGKTGINHAAGKNLIGAFYQPPLVLADPTLLATLPPRELCSGWAEVVKHALIQRSIPGGECNDLLPFLERNAPRLRDLAVPATAWLIHRNVELKAAVVAADEKESGVRAYLNFGHTLGHAIEAADYSLLHGEAVALGMRAAARIGQVVGTCDAAWVARVDDVLDAFDLPRRAPLVPEKVLAKLGSDKKRRRGRQRWILPRTGGGVEVRDDVPATVAAEALAAVRDG